MALLTTKNNLRLRRGTVEEIRGITDPGAFALAAADYLNLPPITLPPITLPPTFVPAGSLLCGMKAEAWNRVKAVPLCAVDGRLSVAFAECRAHW